ncbi:MAG TPA: hypothetical protein PLS24_02885, partial [Sedimentisphaerales bacterium]|nr:hypothetical protein [Sedimentisphaerales bacterium]
EQAAKTPYGQDAKIARKGYYFVSSWRTWRFGESPSVSSGESHHWRPLWEEYPIAISLQKKSAKAKFPLTN